MFPKWRRFALLLVIVLAACSEKPSEPLRLGTNVWPGYEPFYLARELGYLDDEIRLVEYASASQVINAFRNGVIEAAALTLDEVLLLVQHDFDVKVVLVIDISAGADAILGKPPIQTMGDIVHKRVGVESSALGAYVLSRALEIAGLDYEDVLVVPLEVNEHERAFRDGKIDVVVTFEPVRTKLLESGANLLFDSRQIPNEIVDVLVVEGQFLEKHPDRVGDLTRAWFQALNYFAANPKDGATRMGRRLSLSPEEILRGFEGLELPSQDENRRLLAGEIALSKTARRLADQMLKHDLLHTLVEPDRIFELPHGVWPNDPS